MKRKEENKNSKKKFIFLGIGLGVIALGGFGYYYFVGRKGAVTPEDDIITQVTQEETIVAPPKPKSSGTSSSTPKPGSSASPQVEKFVLQKGSKGEKVKQLQQALITKYGHGTLPKYGADGIWGKELTDTLIAKGLPVKIDADTFNIIISASAPALTTSSNLPAEDKLNIDIAKSIWEYCTTKKLNLLLEQLKRIKDVSHYVKVNELFKTIRLNGVRQTIVNGALSSFEDDETSKQFIRTELVRIGLKYDGDKWSLSGLGERTIYSNQKTTAFTPGGLKVNIPANTLLGFVKLPGRFNTKFRTLNNQILYVPTKHIRYV